MLAIHRRRAAMALFRMDPAASQFSPTIIDVRTLFAILSSEGVGLYVLSLAIDLFR